MGSIGSRMQHPSSHGDKKSKVNLEVRGQKLSPKPRNVHREVSVVQPIRQQQQQQPIKQQPQQQSKINNQSKPVPSLARPKNSTKELPAVEGVVKPNSINEKIDLVSTNQIEKSKVIEVRQARDINRVDMSEKIDALIGAESPIEPEISADRLDDTTPSPTKPEVATPADLSDGCDVSIDELCESPTNEINIDLENMDDLPEIDSLEATNVSSLRIREIIILIEKSGLPTSNVIVGNLKYAVKVLDFVFETETKRLCGEEDENELSEVNESAVPSEVKDWLAQTFTRSMSNIKRFQDKPRFRSVANAIRAGIMVDRIYRRMSSTLGIHIPSNVLDMLKDLDDWQFNVFSINEASEGHSLRFVAYEVIQKYNLLRKFKIDSQTMDNLLNQLEAGYSKYGNPYHNLIHAADVTQTTHHFLMNSGLQQLWLTDIEVFAIIFASMIHDFEHTGTTNAFHINSNSNLALIYNDKSVLENHHASAIFRILRDEENNILSSFKREEYKEFRLLVIEMVLATDMSSHFLQIKTMKSLLSMPENIDKCKALSLMVHCADISHPGKPWALHTKWTDYLMSEYFKQGDREAELGINISPLCDRHNTLIAESQIGFIDFIVDPSFQVMSDAVDKILSQLTNSEDATTSGDKDGSNTSRYKIERHWNPHLNGNKQRWKDRAILDAEERAKKEEKKSDDKDENKNEDEPETDDKTGEKKMINNDEDKDGDGDNKGGGG